MENILVVEDSILSSQMIVNRLTEINEFKVICVKNMAEAVKFLDNFSEEIFAAIVEFNLPDAPNGEVINIFVEKNIPVIVFTVIINKEVRDIVWSKSVTDYVLKIDPHNLDYIIVSLRRLKKNPGIKIIVAVKDEPFAKEIKRLLNIHRYNVIVAEDGLEALKLIENNPETKVIITELNIPKMDGFALIYHIRERYTKDDLAVIGINPEDDPLLSTRFIKYGANDIILKKSFIPEDFYRHITQNLENIEHIEMVRNASLIDFLTGLNNRRYFFEFGQKLIENALRNNISLTCAMLDIDEFKKINDTYGHDTGDLVLRQISSILKSKIRKSDIVARIGGEEFCILAVNMKKEFVFKVFDTLRKQIENNCIDIGNGNKINITVSIGVYNNFLPNLDDILKKSDDLLYEAKKTGRNKIVISG